MEKKRGGVQLFLMCCTGILGVGLFSLPTAAAHFGATFYWGYILLGALVALAVLWLFCAATDGTFYETCSARFPRLAKGLALFYALFYTAVSAFLFSYYAHTVQGWFLDGVPRFFIALFLIAVCLHAASKGTRELSRLIGFISVFVLLAVVLMRFVMLCSGDLRNLMPAFEAEQTAQLPSGVLFLSGFFVLVGVVGISRAPRHMKITASGSAVLVCALVFILATAGCMSVLGPVQTAQHLNSSVLAMKNLNLSKMDFFQRGDIVFIVTWSFLILSAGALAGHIPYKTVREVYPNLKHGWIYCIFFLIYALVSAFVPSEEGALLFLIYTVMSVGSLALILLPLILLLTKRREKR